MRLRTLFLTLFLSVSCVAHGSVNLLNRNDIKHAIAVRETSNSWWKIGALGERSQYQFLKSTWRMYSKVDFRHASEKAYQYEVDRVANVYLQRIIERLTQEHLAITPMNVALRWTCGIEAQYYKIPKWFYAKDVESLYQSYQVKSKIFALN